MRPLLLGLVLIVGVGGTTPALAAPCKDAKGKFVACPKPAVKASARCKDARGKFAKCGAPGSVPAK